MLYNRFNYLLILCFGVFHSNSQLLISTNIPLFRPTHFWNVNIKCACCTTSKQLLTNLAYAKESACFSLKLLKNDVQKRLMINPG